MLCTFVEFIRAAHFKPYPKSLARHMRELYWSRFTPLPRAPARKNRGQGAVNGKLLATAHAAFAAKARGDYATYAAKAEEVLAHVECLTHLPIGRCPDWLAELYAHCAKKTVPWHNGLDAVPGHFLRISHDDPGKVAYYRSATKLLEGKQLRTTPGKYLAEFYPHLGAEDVKQWSAACSPLDASRLVLLGEDNEDEWIDTYAYPVSAYGSGCSCMRGTDSVSVYAYHGNGLRLATLWEGAPLDSRLIARSIVRLDTTPPQYIRPYTLVGGPLAPEQFGALLQQAGYVWGNLDGVKVQSIEHDDGGYVMPYIDSGNGGEQHAEACCGYLLLGDGDLDCTNTDGRAGGLRSYCDHCRNHVDDHPDDMAYIEGVGSVCQDCLDDDFVSAIVSWRDWDRYSGREYALKDDCTYDESTGEYVLGNITDERGDTCERCGDYYSDSDDLTEALDSYGDVIRTCCTSRLESLDLTYSAEPDVEQATSDATVWVRNDTCLAHKLDCWQRDGQWYLNDDHPDYDAEQDDPDYEEDNDESEPNTSCEPQLAHTQAQGDNDAYQLAA